MKKKGKDKKKGGGVPFRDVVKEWNKKYVRKSARRLAKQYAKLPYHVVVQHFPGKNSGYFFSVKELRGAMGYTDTWKELDKEIKDVMVEWIAWALEDGLPVKLPKPY